MRPGLVAVLSIALAAGSRPAAVSTPEQDAAQSLRKDFLQTIARPRAALAPSAAKVSLEGDYSQELLSFASEPGERVPLLIVTKAPRRERRPAVIALHGTGGSKEGMRTLLKRYADRGFVAVA